MTSSTERKLADELRLDRIARLLAHYADIDAPEVAEITRFLNKGPPVGVAMLCSREAPKWALARFRGDHRRELALGSKGLVAVAAIVAPIAVAVLPLRDAGTRN